MIILLSILTFVVAWCMTLIIHDLGHFITARVTGIPVDVFSIGFGKRLFGKKIRGTDFRISCIPIGGFIKVAGIHTETNSLQNASPSPPSIPVEKPVSRVKKIIVLFMGPLISILMAFFLLTILNLEEKSVLEFLEKPPVIGYVQKGSPAEQAGLKKGDLILKIDEKQISSWRDLTVGSFGSFNPVMTIHYKRENKLLNTTVRSPQNLKTVPDIGIHYGFKPHIRKVAPGSPANKAGLQPDDIIETIDGNPVTIFQVNSIITKAPGKQLRIGISRNDVSQHLYVTPQVKEFEGGQRVAIGIEIIPEYTERKIRPSLWESVKKTKSDIVFNIKAHLSKLEHSATGETSPKKLSGPLEIALNSKSDNKNPIFILILMAIAFNSLYFGLYNLIPLLPFDGGHILLQLLELFFGTDYSLKFKRRLSIVGYILLGFLGILFCLDQLFRFS